MFSRGNATSGAPICSGMIAFAKPANSGVANSSSMIRPCIVNIWLYSVSLTNWVPGSKSSARITSASRPPMRKKRNDDAMYMLPITL